MNQSGRPSEFDLIANTIRDLTEKAREQGKIAASFALSADHAVELRGYGVQLMALLTDSDYLRLGAQTLLDQVRR